MDSIWNESGVPEYRHFLIAFYFSLFFLGARFFLDSFIYPHLAVKLLNEPCVPSKLSYAKRVKLVKCSESLWKITYYGAAEICVLLITYSESWFTDTKEYFRGWPNQQLKFSLKLYYMCQCGFYFYSIAALLTWETRRKDFSIMMSHHIITFFLIAYSYVNRFFRIGSIVLALHDASDVLLEIAKVLKYSEKEMLASVSFGLFSLSWLLLRLIFFPFWIIRATSFDLVKVLNMLNSYHLLLYYIFNAMLLNLLVFHIYWWILICSMVLRQLKNRGKVGEDIRSDSEGED